MIQLVITAPTRGEVQAHFERMRPALEARGYLADSMQASRDPDRAGARLIVTLSEELE